MRARHFYCSNFIKKFLGKKFQVFVTLELEKVILLMRLLKNKLTSKILFTEHSLKNIRNIKNVLKYNKKKYFFFNGSIEESHNNKDF